MRVVYSSSTGACLRLQAVADALSAIARKTVKARRTFQGMRSSSAGAHALPAGVSTLGAAGRRYDSYATSSWRREKGRGERRGKGRQGRDVGKGDRGERWERATGEGAAKALY